MTGFGGNGIAASGNEAELRGVGFETLGGISVRGQGKNKRRIWRE